MEFFDSLISDVHSLLQSFSLKKSPYNPKDVWEDVGHNQMILQRDAVGELQGIGFNLVCTKSVEDSVIVIGDDLDKIQGNMPFARISIIEMDSVDDEQKAHNLIKKIEYTKYHTFPDGYMMRTSSFSQEEVVRVSRASVKNGMSFQNVGNLFIKKYKENQAVKGVTVIFITDKNMDFNALKGISQKNSDITKALNHVMNSVTFDCNACNLKAICDEVEGMKELHFKNAGM